MGAIGLMGLGYAVPPQVRRNDDPIFETLRRAAGAGGEHALFYGNKERRCLGPGESLAALTAQAASAALADAGVSAGDVDRLYGYLSVSDYIAPNGLYEVHRDLGLAEHTLVVPVHSEFSNFILGLVLASEAIQSGHARNVLVAVGGCWTRSMDYSQGHSISVGDGAGAALVGPSDRLNLVDWAADTFSREYGVMALRRWPEKTLDHPTYGIDPSAGIEAFLTTGMEGPPRLVRRLVEKNGIAPSEITLVTHQATRKLMEHWAERIKPYAYLDTFDEFGNMVIASIPVTLARYSREIETRWLVLAGLGIGGHQMALLLRV